MLFTIVIVVVVIVLENCGIENVFRRLNMELLHECFHMSLRCLWWRTLLDPKYHDVSQYPGRFLYRRKIVRSCPHHAVVAISKSLLLLLLLSTVHLDLQSQNEEERELARFLSMYRVNLIQRSPVLGTNGIL